MIRKEQHSFALDTSPEGAFSEDQIGTDPNSNNYTIVWPSKCDPRNRKRPIYLVAVGDRDYVLYQVTWQRRYDYGDYDPFVGDYCAVVTNLFRNSKLLPSDSNSHARLHF